METCCDIQNTTSQVTYPEIRWVDLLKDAFLPICGVKLPGEGRSTYLAIYGIWRERQPSMCLALRSTRSKGVKNSKGYVPCRQSYLTAPSAVDR